MRKKLRLLTVVSMATNSKQLSYKDLKEALALESVRELEDLIIEGANFSVIQGKLDQKSLHFEVDFVMARDIQTVNQLLLKWVFLYSICHSISSLTWSTSSLLWILGAADVMKCFKTWALRWRTPMTAK